MEDKKIKILYLLNSSEIGGTEKSLLLLIDNLNKKKFDIYIICLRGEGTFTDEIKKRNIFAYIYDLKKEPLSIFIVYKKIKKINPDICQSFLFISNLIGRILGKIAGIKIIISSQRSVDKWRKWYHWKIDRLTSKLSTIIISNSFSGKKYLVEKGKINEKKIVVIPNGVKYPTEKRTFSKSSFGFSENSIVIGNVGNLRKVKGQEIFIKICKVISENFPDVKFLIAGEGPLKVYLKHLTEVFGVKDKFVFAGFVKEIERVYSAIDIFVLTSQWEGCPLSVLEAMSFGIPVVSFSVGDVPYIIQNGKDGFVVKDRNSEELVNKIKQLLEDKNLREIIGINAKEKIKKEFTIDKMVERYSELYINLLK